LVFIVFFVFFFFIFSRVFILFFVFVFARLFFFLGSFFQVTPPPALPLFYEIALLEFKLNSQLLLRPCSFSLALSLSVPPSLSIVLSLLHSRCVCVVMASLQQTRLAYFLSLYLLSLYLFPVSCLSISCLSPVSLHLSYLLSIFCLSISGLS